MTTRHIEQARALASIVDIAAVAASWSRVPRRVGAGQVSYRLLEPWPPSCTSV